MGLKKIILDDSTGEVLSEVKIKTAKENSQYEIMSKIKEQNILSSYLGDEVGGYINLFFDKVERINYLTDAEKMRLIYFMTYSNYEGVLVIQKKGYRDVCLNKKMLMSESNLKTRTFNATFKILIDNEIIIEDDGKLKINRLYSIKGGIPKTNNEDYARVFIETVRFLFKNCNGKDHKLLYYLFRLLPSVHINTNMLCFNPLEEDISEIDAMSMSKICDCLGYDSTNQSRLLSDIMRLSINKKPVFGKFSTIYGKDKFMVNPRLYYMGKDYDCYIFLDKLFNL